MNTEFSSKSWKTQREDILTCFIKPILTTLLEKNQATVQKEEEKKKKEKEGGRGGGEKNTEGYSLRI